jgi:UDP-3-O-[3-hydroxymyristoyl] N-acetylglucosamine deacetylase
MPSPSSLISRTLNNPVEVKGIGLHTGVPVSVRLMPSEHLGLVFVRTDLNDRIQIPASLRFVTTTKHATTLAQGEISLATIEHLLAALWAQGISNCRIEVDGPEIPILDGSAAGWCEALQRAGVRNLEGVRPLYGLREPVFIEESGGAVLGLPHLSLRVSVAVEYQRSYLTPQAWDGEIDSSSFSQIASARTFTLEEWIEPLRSAGLIKGGDEQNAIVLFNDHMSVPLRYPNELARHKALDVVGDIALLFGEEGGMLSAHIIAVRAGHGSHRRWMDEVLRQNALVRLN